ncbi:IS256 family transposase [Streptomyces sp. NPDC006476]|uniref:IS256 family transposase n=1 Tax=Streptomyces sp. NPDC006476 TaxID=3157175 RepID=UPI0033A0C169
MAQEKASAKVTRQEPGPRPLKAATLRTRVVFDGVTVTITRWFRPPGLWRTLRIPLPEILSAGFDNHDGEDTHSFRLTSAGRDHIWVPVLIKRGEQKASWVALAQTVNEACAQRMRHVLGSTVGMGPWSEATWQRVDELAPELTACKSWIEQEVLKTLSERRINTDPGLSPSPSVQGGYLVAYQPTWWGFCPMGPQDTAQVEAWYALIERLQPHGEVTGTPEWTDDASALLAWGHRVRQGVRDENRGPGERRICGDLDVELSVFRTRPLDHTCFPYVYLDATYCKARVNHQIVSQAVVIATGITEDGGREVLGLMVGDSESEVFWSEFLRSLRERGLTGVRLVIADHHSGLVKAVRKVMLGAAYQRCRVHFLRNVFAVIPKDAAEMGVAATIRTIFAQPTADAVRAQLKTVADMLGRQFPKVRAMLLEAKVDLTAFADFPERHWKKIQSTKPLERVNREIKRRVDVVQIFSNPDALERLTTAVLIEMHDEWITFPRRYLPEGSMDKIYPPDDQPGTATPLQGT